jgi:hypothetical protein
MSEAVVTILVETRFFSKTSSAAASFLSEDGGSNSFKTLLQDYRCHSPED